MRISDWSSDVCSSDLLADMGLGDVVTASDAISDLEIGSGPLVECIDAESARGFQEAFARPPATTYQTLMREGASGQPNSMRLARHREDVRERFARILAECRRGVRMDDNRSEERRVGKGCVQ